MSLINIMIGWHIIIFYFEKQGVLIIWYSKGSSVFAKKISIEGLE